MAPRSTVHWLTDDEQRAWRGLLRMHSLLSIRLNRNLIEQAGISAADYAVLVSLSEAPEGRLRAFELCRETQWEKSRLSHHLTRMEKRGLVLREECTTDARGAFVALTDAGWSTIRAVAPEHVESVRQLFVDVLTPAQLSTMSKIAGTVIARLEAMES